MKVTINLRQTARRKKQNSPTTFSILFATDTAWLNEHRQAAEVLEGQNLQRGERK